MPAIWVITPRAAWRCILSSRRYRLESTLGTYLDPLADKALVAGTAMGLLHHGLLPGWAVGAFLARDTGLVLGALALRHAELGGRWRGWRAFFEVDAALRGAQGAGRVGGGKGGGERGEGGSGGSSGGSGGRDQASGTAARRVEPHLVSKVNTCLQLALGAAALGQCAAQAGEVRLLHRAWAWATARPSLMLHRSPLSRTAVVGCGVGRPPVVRRYTRSDRARPVMGSGGHHGLVRCHLREAGDAAGQGRCLMKVGLRSPTLAHDSVSTASVGVQHRGLVAFALGDPSFTHARSSFSGQFCMHATA